VVATTALAVAALAVRDGAVLLVRQEWAAGRWLWSPPGGLVEAGESVLEAAWTPVDEALRLLRQLPFPPMRDPVLAVLKQGSVPTWWSWITGVDTEPVVVAMG
jgi:hypothetical protein